MLRFDFQKPREMELFAQLISDLQDADARFEVEEISGGYGATIYFLNGKGERL